MSKKYITLALILCGLMLAAGQTTWADTVTCTINDFSHPCLHGFSSNGFGGTPATWAITNNTGVTWTDFHLSLDFGDWDSTVYSGPGSVAFPNPTTITLDGLGTFTYSLTMDITGLDIPDGGTLNFSNQWLCFGEACSLGYFAYGTPTTGGGTGGGGTTVPEPSSLLLLGSGLLGMLGLRRKKGTA